MNELKRIDEQEEAVIRDNILYKQYKNTYTFTKFKMMRTFGYEIINGINTVNMEDNKQNQWAKKKKKKKKKKRICLQC